MTKQQWKRTVTGAIAICVLWTTASHAGQTDTQPSLSQSGEAVAHCPAQPQPQPQLMLADASSVRVHPKMTVFGAQSIDMRDDGYDSSYMFGMTRGVSASALHPGVKPLLFLVTIPLDIALLPFAAIGGFF